MITKTRNKMFRIGSYFAIQILFLIKHLSHCCQFATLIVDRKLLSSIKQRFVHCSLRTQQPRLRKRFTTTIHTLNIPHPKSEERFLYLLDMSQKHMAIMLKIWRRSAKVCHIYCSEDPFGKCK